MNTSRTHEEVIDCPRTFTEVHTLDGVCKQRVLEILTHASQEHLMQISFRACTNSALLRTEVELGPDCTSIPTRQNTS